MTSGLKIEVDEVVVEVGGKLTGQIARLADSSGTRKQARSVRLTLGYFTTGRGDTNRKDVAKTEFPCDTMGAVQGDFSLVLPNSVPISYDGQLMRVQWLLTAQLDIKMGRDPIQERNILVVPKNGFAVYDQPHPLRQI